MSNSTDQSQRARRIWKPHSGQQEEAFKHFHVYEIFYGGAKGGGKTDWLIWDFIEPTLIEKSNYRGIIFRRTYPRLREIIDRSHLYFQGQAHYRKGENSWTWPSGAKLFFAHCQYEEDKYNYQGHEYQYMGFDQLEEFTFTQYEFLKVQARSTDPKLPVRIRTTGNPGNIGHLWVKARFIDNKEPMVIYKDEHGLTSMFIPATVYDNPSLMENDPTYVKRLEALPETERKALLEGDWNIFAGQYFNEWSSGNVVKPFYLPASYIRFIAGDYGFSKPASIGWYAIDYDGNIYRYREIYEERMHYDELAELICELSKHEEIQYAVFDPAIFGDKEHHRKGLTSKEGKSGADIMNEVIREKRGGERAFPIVRGDNRRLPGWGNVRLALKDKFKVFSSCTNFIRTFPANVHDEKRPEDLDTNAEDHTADEARYAIQSITEKASMKVKEKINPNSPWGRYLESKKENQEFTYGRE